MIYPWRSYGAAAPWTDSLNVNDRTAPENPAALAHSAGAENEIWQRQACQADFTWSKPTDEGSGVAGYEAIWRIDDGATVREATTALTAERFQSTTPPCTPDSVYTNTLLLRTIDAVGNLSERSTAFTLRYDNAEPTVQIRFSGGVTETAQTRVMLEIAPSDRGSGIDAMRFSGDGRTWTEWEAIAPSKIWQIPGISRQSWPVYVQIRDRVGLTSAVVSSSITLNVNRRYPRSQNFRLFASSFASSASRLESAVFRSRGTLGQSLVGAAMRSSAYRISGGYEMANQAIPLAVPISDQFTAAVGSIASGTVATPLRSPSYRMLNSIGQAALPNNQTTIFSPQFQHRPGYLATFPVSSISLLPVGPAPEPPPTPECAFAGVTINNDDAYTQATSVVLTLCAPFAVTMRLSADPQFADAGWEAYTTERAWTINGDSAASTPQTVYVWFRSADGTIYGSYADDILYDPTPPDSIATVSDSASAGSPLALVSGMAALTMHQPQTPVVASGSFLLSISGNDTVSGISATQISEHPGFAGAVWDAYTPQPRWSPGGPDRSGTIYVRTRDDAGNMSRVTTIDFTLDSQAPSGSVVVDRPVIGPQTAAIILYLAAEDESSGVESVRIGEDSALADAIWQPYQEILPWALPSTLPTSGTIYVQYRDRAGNTSPIISADYALDTQAPRLMGSFVAPGASPPQINIQAEDDRAGVAWLYLSNDPAFVNGVTIVPYTSEAISWVFDDRQVVWLALSDAVGNRSEPYAIPLQHARTSTIRYYIQLPIIMQ